MHSIRAATRVTGPIFYMFISFAALLISRQIANMRSCMSFSAIPFYSLLVNAFVSSLYSIAVKDAVLLAPNLVGFLIAIQCVFTYTYYAVEPVNYRVQLLSLYICISAAIAFYFAASTISYLAILMDITCFVMLSSPMASIRKVLKNRNTSSIVAVIDIYISM